MWKRTSIQIAVGKNVGERKFSECFLENNMLCDLCKLFLCIQPHPLQCPKLTSLLIVKNLHISETFVYGNDDQQLLYVKIYKQYWDLKEQKVKEQNEDWESQNKVTPVVPVMYIFCVAVWFCYVQLSYYKLLAQSCGMGNMLVRSIGRGVFNIFIHCQSCSPIQLKGV